MKPNIQQHVVSRSTARLAFAGAGTFAWQGGAALPRNTRRHARATSSMQWGNINSNTLTIVLGVLAVIVVGTLGFAYLNQVMTTAGAGTDIHDVESQILELRERQKGLELEGAQLRSIQSIEGSTQSLNLVATDKVSYLAQTPDRVAQLSQ